MADIPRLDAFQRRHRILGFPLAVLYKFTDDQGAYLAALIAYYGLLSLFPLLLLLSTILGIVLDGDAGLQRQVVDSALSQVPVIGPRLGSPDQISGGPVAIVVGTVLSLYGGLGVAQALQNAANVAWLVPRNSRPNQLYVRLRGLGILGILALNVAVTTSLTALSASDVLPGTVTSRIATGLSLVLGALIFALMFRLSAATPLRLRDVLPGAIIAACIWQALQRYGTVLIGEIVARASETAGTFAVLIGLIAFLYLSALMVVVCIEVDVVRVRKLHPRALLTPFTDSVVLTPGDERQYTRAAQAQRNKGFETIEVRFDDDAAPGEPGAAPVDRPSQDPG